MEKALLNGKITTIGNIIKCIQDGIITIPDNQRDCKTKGKKYNNEVSNYICNILSRLIKNEGRFNKKFKDAENNLDCALGVTDTIGGYVDVIAISTNINTKQSYIQDGQHRYCYYLNEFLYNNFCINVDNSIDPDLKAYCDSNKITVINAHSMKKWIDKILASTVICNCVYSEKNADGAKLFCDVNTCVPVTKYDQHKARNCESNAWKCLRQVMNAVNTKNEEFTLMLDGGKKTKTYTKSQMDIIRALVPNKDHTAMYFFIRNLSLADIVPVDYQWKKGMSQDEIITNFFVATENISEDDMNKAIFRLLNKFIKIATYFGNKKDMDKLSPYQSIITSLAYNYKTLTKTYDNDTLKYAIGEFVNNAFDDSMKIKYNNAHYQFSKLEDVYSDVCSLCEEYILLTKKGVA